MDKLDRIGKARGMMTTAKMLVSQQLDAMKILGLKTDKLEWIEKYIQEVSVILDYEQTEELNTHG